MSDLLDFSPPGQTTFVLSGAKARFYDAGTTTLRQVFADQAETVPHPSPLLADASGRFPQAFVSGGPVKVVVTQADDSTGYTLDPCEKVAASGAGASQISFSPTIALPFDNVQAAIEGAAASAASGFAAFGLGVTGSVALIANLDATNIASGQYRFDATTTGTFPTGVAAADTGAVELVRETSGSAWMRLFHDTSNRIFSRRLNASTWGAWREDITVNIGATRGDIIFRGASDWTRLAAGPAGSVLRSGGAGADPSWGNGTLTYTAAQATTSGTAFDFTIPAGSAEVVILFDGVSVTATDNILVQPIDGGGAQTTGYVSRSSLAGQNFTSTATNGYVIYNPNTAGLFTGVMRLTRWGATNKWISDHAGDNGAVGAASVVGGGVVTLDDGLVGVRITRSGTNTFDAGSIIVGYR